MVTVGVPQEVFTVTSDGRPTGILLGHWKVPPEGFGQVTVRSQRQALGNVTMFALVEIAPIVESPLPFNLAPVPKLIAPAAITVPWKSWPL